MTDGALATASRTGHYPNMLDRGDLIGSGMHCGVCRGAVGLQIRHDVRLCHRYTGRRVYEGRCDRWLTGGEHDAGMWVELSGLLGR